MSKNMKIVMAVAMLAGALGLWSYSDLWLGTYLANFVQASAYWLSGLVVAAVGGVTAWWLAVVRDDNRRYHGDPVGSRLPIGIAGLLTVAGALFFVFTLVYGGYAYRQAYLPSASATEETHPTFAERPAYDLAVNQRNSDKDLIRGEIVDTTYLAEKGVYTHLVQRPGVLKGYAGVMEQTLSLTGDATVATCEFDKAADKRMNGLFTHSIERALSHIERRLIVNEQDVYGYCDGDTPMVVLPLQKLRGWFPAVEMPAGVALYNGRTGELDVHKTLASGTVPGPVYPASLAESQRQSLEAHEAGFVDYFWKRAGFADTSGDEGDPNAENRSEFVLETTAGDDVVVTPLTMRSSESSTKIVALGVVETGSVTAGTLNPITVYTSTDRRKANSEVADDLRTDYADLPDWAAGMKIFEIMPVSGTEWVASLGFEKNISYRVRLNADGSSCLEDAEGTQIRCGRATATHGNGPGVELADGGTGTPVQVPASTAELKALTDAELAALQRQITDELVRRLESR